MYNMHPVTPEEQESLEEVCQRNDWLKRGGCDWQDDPYLEEYPYEFDRCFSIDDLSDFFQAGNWAIRQGVVYGDLAFIQQVNGGDEWWALKKDGDDWIPFESVNFKPLAKDRSELVRHIAGMRLATPEECKHLDYLPERAGLTWGGDAFPYLDDGSVKARGENFVMLVEATRTGKMLTFKGAGLIDISEHDQEDMTLIQTINAQISAYEQHMRQPQAMTIGQRIKEAVRAVKSQDRAERAADPRVGER
ncbi:hypothetical protein [Adlercreutzia sp. ZJ141]|uniref:hypothetical protein n=1 Tax=Adlercreutzia sp. ZJ141 TaxID=2709406 RepID=UPI0013ED8F8E|nr:hypothetical protein [Adlercreutzia sp. ZJ141]